MAVAQIDASVARRQEQERLVGRVATKLSAGASVSVLVGGQEAGQRRAGLADRAELRG